MEIFNFLALLKQTLNDLLPESKTERTAEN